MIGMSDIAMMTSSYDLVVMGTPVSAAEIAVRHVYKGDEALKGTTLAVKGSSRLATGTVLLLGLSRDFTGKFAVIETIET